MSLSWNCTRIITLSYRLYSASNLAFLNVEVINGWSSIACLWIKNINYTSQICSFCGNVQSFIFNTLHRADTKYYAYDINRKVTRLKLLLQTSTRYCEQLCQAISKCNIYSLGDLEWTQNVVHMNIDLCGLDRELLLNAILSTSCRYDEHLCKVISKSIQWFE